MLAHLSTEPTLLGAAKWTRAGNGAYAVNTHHAGIKTRAK